MITAGEPQDFIPLGREHLKVHPGDVFLSKEHVPPATHEAALSGDILKALRRVSLKEKCKEQWFLKQSDDSEEEFYWNNKTVVWSKSSGHGIHKVLKCYTMENPVLQVLWTEFRICSCKPRIMDSEPEMENADQESLAGVCVIETSSLSFFGKTGEDFVVATPFETARAWTTKFGIIFERNTANGEQKGGSEETLYKNQTDNLPVIFSMMHPLDDIAPVLKKSSSPNAHEMSYFCDFAEEIIFSCIEPSLVMTYNKNGHHSVWKLRTTTFEEADFACCNIQLTAQSRTQFTPAAKLSSKTICSKVNVTGRTPSNWNSPFHSHPSSHLASPMHTSTSSITSLKHMATLSRSQPPNSNVSQPQNFTPLSALTNRSPFSHLIDDRFKFIEPLAPDICFEHQWSDDLKSLSHPEKAVKAFLSNDILDHKYLCYFLKDQRLLRLVKFEKTSHQQWIFGSTATISALDAESLSDLNLIITVDSNFSLSLYTGFSKVCQVHVADMFGPASELSSSNINPMPSFFFATPKRKSLMASTRPTSAASTKFGDDSQMLSPVPMVVDETMKSVLSEDMSFFDVGPVKSLRDSVRNRVTLETSAGFYRLEIPEVASSNSVRQCLEALKYVLPKDTYIQVFIKWYSTRNTIGPDDMGGKSELNLFLLTLLNLLGFDADKVVLGECVKNDSFVPIQIKKQKTHEKGCQDDWNSLKSVSPPKLFSELNFVADSTAQNSPQEHRLFNDTAVLFPYISHVFFSLHLIYEDSKLKMSQWGDLSQMCSFLCELARELRQFSYLDHYWKDFPDHFKPINKCFLVPEGVLPKASPLPVAPCIYDFLNNCLFSSSIPAFPYIPHVTKMLQGVVLVYVMLSTIDKPLKNVSDYLIPISGHGTIVHDDIDNRLLTFCYKKNTNPKKAAVYLITKLGMTVKDLDGLPPGIGLPFKDALLKCWHEPSGLWSKDMFDLIGRRDLSLLQTNKKRRVSAPTAQPKPENNKNNAKEIDESFNYLDMDVLRLRWGKDHRIHDVFNMLQSSKPVRINVPQRPEVSDHDFIEEQERHLYNLCIRTMAATVGRGMFTLRTHEPVVTETLPIPKLCLTGRAPQRNTTVDLSHIDVPPNMNMWPLFHNGVAAGLSVSLSASKIDSTWMVYNKPKTTTVDSLTEHAGFLMALGLNGHLSRLTALSKYDYLAKSHELTTVGILLGIAASKRGSMDLRVTKMLSIHIEALLPPTSTELDVAPGAQVAAVMGLGLLYQGSGHQHMARILLGEIGRPPGPEMEHSIDRESYSLAAGLALGLITLEKGKEMSSVADLPMADHLYHYMIGGHKRPLSGTHKEKHKSPSYQIREGDNVNVDVTSPGATLALGMMFFNTGNQAIADWMTAPDTQFLLDMVRPDFLLLRTISKGLILWSRILPAEKWVESHLPEIVAKHAFQKGVTRAEVDYETMSQAYCNIIAGSCFCLGLKFAGSANAEAFATLMKYAKHFLHLSRNHTGEQAGRSTIETCLNVVVLSLSMVMAGTGDLDMIRICRHLRSRISQAASYVLYGSHMATHMALGLLFLGGGRYTFSTSPLSIGAMVCAFFPKFPQHSNDNRYHLQAFYHLYVLAVEPRLIIPRLIDCKTPVYLSIKLKFKDTEYYKNQEYTVKAPCILPELKYLKQVIIDDSRYWPIVFDCDENWDSLQNVLENDGDLHVMQNAGCLPYNEDPKGFQSLLAQSYIWNYVHAWNIQNNPISNFSSDPVALNFASCFLTSSVSSEKEKEWQQKMCGYLFECASLEKMDALAICIAMIQMSKQKCFHGFELWQMKLMCAHEQWLKRYSALSDDSLSLLRPAFSLALFCEMKQTTKAPVLDLKEDLLRYITENWTPGDQTLSVYPTDLANFLLLHGVQTPQTVKDTPGVVSLPYLLNRRHDFKLTVPSMMTILSILS